MGKIGEFIESFRQEAHGGSEEDREQLMLQRIDRAEHDVAHSGEKPVEQYRLEYLLFLKEKGETDRAKEYLARHPEMKEYTELSDLVEEQE